jgi:hypothetical protein
VTGTSKISALLLYTLHYGYKPSTSRLVNILIILVGVWTLAAFIPTVFQCTPISAVWIGVIRPDQHCFDRNIFFTATSIAEAIINLVLLLLPIPNLFRLNWYWRTVISIGPLYIAGIFVLFSTILRAYYSTSAVFDPLVSFAQPHTKSGTAPLSIATFTPFFLWSVLIQSFTLQIISMPTLFPALIAIFTCDWSRPQDRAHRKIDRFVQSCIRAEGWEFGEKGGIARKPEFQGEGFKRWGTFGGVKGPFDREVAWKENLAGAGAGAGTGGIGGTTGPTTAEERKRILKETLEMEALQRSSNSSSSSS